jgi:lipoprotein NlpI
VGRYEEATEDLDKAQDLAPKTPLVHSSRGFFYHQKGQYDLAIREYTEAIALAPGFAQPYRSRGVVYLGLADFEKAITDLSKSAELDPRSAYSQLFLFLARQHSGKDGKPALAEFRKALGNDDWPAPAVKMLLGEITPEQCLAAAAHKEAWWQKVLRCEAYYYIGQFHLLRGEKDSARRCFSDCIGTGMTEVLEHASADAGLKRLEKP